MDCYFFQVKGCIRCYVTNIFCILDYLFMFCIHLPTLSPLFLPYYSIFDTVVWYEYFIEGLGSVRFLFRPWWNKSWKTPQFEAIGVLYPK